MPPILGGEIKQCECMVVLRDFPYTWALFGLVMNIVEILFFPKQCGNTWGSYGSSKRPGWLDRGGGRAVCGIHRYFRGFVPVCSFRL